MNSETPDAKKGLPDDDRKELYAILESLEPGIRDCESDPFSEANQVSVCLLTRSAYTEFYSLSVFRDEIDSKLSNDLLDRFRQVVKMLPEGEYRHSIKNRTVECEEFCRRTSDQSLIETE